MHPFIQQHSFVISTLGAVHIGCGQEMVPGEYLVDEGYVYFLDKLQLANALSPALQQSLLTLLDGDHAHLISQVQQFFHQHRADLIPAARQCVPVSRGMAHFLDEGMRLKGKNIGKHAIGRTTFNPMNGSVYIPGSTLKGAIRTAVLDALNKGRSGISKQGLEQELLKYKDALDDPFKDIKVSDAPWTSEHPATDFLFGLNKPRKQKSTDKNNDLPVQLECIGPARSQALPGDIRIVSRKTQASFNIETLVKCCNRFYRKQFEEELARLEQLGYAQYYPFSTQTPEQTGWAQAMRQLLNGELGKRLEEGSAFLLRIGKHSGAESNTLEGLRQILIRQGPKPSYKASAPTKMWMATGDKKSRHAGVPFGWILVELTDRATPSGAIAASLDALNGQRYADQRDANVQLAQARKTLTDRVAEQKARQQAIAAEAERQATEQAALAAMSPIQRGLAELQAAFEHEQKANTGPQGPLRQQLNEQVKIISSNGNTDEKQALKALALEIFAFWKVDTKKNKKIRDLLKPLND